MIVCNHTGLCEILNMILSPLMPSFIASKEVQRMPFIGTLSRVLQSLYVESNPTKEEKEELLQEIFERQENIIVDSIPYPPLCVFPEGTTSNGDYLLPFNGGAFQAMRTVQPCFVKI